MCRLAPGRTGDMAMLLDRRDKAAFDTEAHRKIQAKIDDLVEEGKCLTICHLRERLVGAARANDNTEIENISELITDHMKRSHRKRFERSWL